MTTVEHLASGRVIGRLGVTDKDGPGVNSQVDLTISPLTPIGNVYFSIDSLGDLRLKQAIDHDVAPTVVLYVVATDRGSPKLSSTGTVTVTVADVTETVLNTSKLNVKGCFNLFVDRYSKCRFACYFIFSK